RSKPGSPPASTSRGSRRPGAPGSSSSRCSRSRGPGARGRSYGFASTDSGGRLSARATGSRFCSGAAQGVRRERKATPWPGTLAGRVGERRVGGEPRLELLRQRGILLEHLPGERLDDVLLTVLLGFEHGVEHVPEREPVRRLRLEQVYRDRRRALIERHPHVAGREVARLAHEIDAGHGGPPA